MRALLLRAAEDDRLRRMVEEGPLTRGVVARYVPGASDADALRVAGELIAAGLLVSIDRLGEDVTTREQADATARAYVGLLDSLAERGYAGPVEVSVKLSALGQALPRDGDKVALDHARDVCATAAAAGTTVTLDMEDHTTTDATLGTLAELRADFPATGVAVQAYLFRTEADCRDLAVAGARVRLCKGAYREPGSVAFQRRDEVDRSYVRCLRTLMAGAGYPMVATHDPRLIEIAGALAIRHGRTTADFEYQMLHGVRPAEQRRLAADGERVRVYVPYGDDWYGYLVRRLAERPANLLFFLRSLAGRG